MPGFMSHIWMVICHGHLARPVCAGGQIEIRPVGCGLPTLLGRVPRHLFQTECAGVERCGRCASYFGEVLDGASALA